MPQPVAEPVGDAAVKTYLSLNDNTEDARVAQVVGAVNVFLRKTEAARRWGLTDPAPLTWPADFVQGGVMLAARLFRRKNSPNGVEAFAVGGPVYVRRNDPDVAMLLDLDAPMVG